MMPWAKYCGFFLPALFLALSCPLPAGPVSPTAEAGQGKVEWQAADKAEALARESGKPILWDFTAPWCQPCRDLAREVFADPDRALWINANFVPARVEDERPKRRTNSPWIMRLQDRFNIKGYPDLVVEWPARGLFTPAIWEKAYGYPGAAATMDFLRQALEKLAGQDRPRAKETVEPTPDPECGETR